MPVRTASQRRREAKLAFDAFLSACPSRQLLEMISDKWVCLVVSALSTGSKRHGELARLIAGVSQKMLTQTLRALERDGLISRKVTATVPLRVDYELTELGRGLLPVLGAVKRWAEGNMETVLSARRAYAQAVGKG
ncbi:MAG: transcriptional regulator, HxlR family [Myxococcaceae bacterium]|nr:transcriptional regulator, HxlR family [Myxococcaceae bacterium]